MLHHRHPHYYKFPVDFSELVSPESEELAHSSGSSRSLLARPDFFAQIDGFVDKSEEGSVEARRTPAKAGSCRCVLLNLVALLLLLLVLAFLLWSLARTPLFCAVRHAGLANHNETDDFDSQFVSDLLMNLIDSKAIRQNLRWMTEKVHLAGTKDQLQLMDRIANEYEKLGFDVRIYEYDVLLSMPDLNRPNSVHLWSEEDGWVVVSKGHATPVGPNKKRDRLGSVWWNAYSGNGTVFAPIVYANYGTEEDFDLLEKAGVNVTGKIVLIRYGAKPRADKVFLAESKGAAAVLLYSDPFDFAPEQPRNNKTFPDQIWLPGTDTQRGTLLGTIGDPQTPGIPAKAWAERAKPETLARDGVVPTIPVMPLGYDDAQVLMENMDGERVTWTRWMGTMSVPYRINSTVRFRVDVNTHLHRAVIRNVVSIWPGREEPDEWVLLSNHVDSWTHGGIDPNSGSAVLLEMANSLRKTAALTGWRPRRSLVFCQWDAEEFGLLGSTEFVEEMQHVLADRAVALLNVDNLNGNVSVAMKAVPLLYRALSRAAAKVRHPNPAEQEQGRRTLLESWLHFGGRGPLPGDKAMPAIAAPIHGSDFQPFLAYLGVPVADFRLESAPQYSYMLYHTSYETAWAVENLVDPTGHVLRAAGQFWVEMARDLADSTILPFDVSDYALVVSEAIADMEAFLRGHGLVDLLGAEWFELRFEQLGHAARQFRHVASKFMQHVQQLGAAAHSPASATRRLNRRLRSLERCFLGPASALRPMQRHLVFRQSRRDALSGQLFAGVLELASGLGARPLRQHDLKTELDRVQLAIQSATLTLDL